MKISMKWLQSFVSVPLTPGLVADVLEMNGFPVEGQLEMPSGDLQIDVEVTSNRGDCLSHLGVAREFAARTQADLKPPVVDGFAETDDVVAITRDDAVVESCSFYTARTVRGVKVAPSPAWLKSVIEDLGLRSVNNVVDVTNYVCHAVGQPLHAFDLSRMQGSTVVIRQSRKGEPFRAIDGSTHELPDGLLVIADLEAPQALAGVMGGLDSEVTGTTQDIVLESGLFDPLAVRKSSRVCKIISDSSSRFERFPDPAWVTRASDWAACLIQRVAGGEIGKLVTVGQNPVKALHVSYDPSRTETLLGLAIDSDVQVSLLERLGFVVESAQTPWQCEVPTWRQHDVTRPIDVLEEVARLNGLDAIPEGDAIDASADSVRPAQESESAKSTAIDTWVALGYYEAITHALSAEKPSKVLASSAVAQQWQGRETAKLFGRPDSTGVLRPCVLAGLLQSAKNNQDVSQSGVRLAELGSAWVAGGEQAPVFEERRASMLLQVITNPQDTLREMRGHVETLARRLGGSDVTCEIQAGGAADTPHADIQVKRQQEQVSIGRFGLVPADVCKAFGLQGQFVYAELKADPLLALFPQQRTAHELPRFPAIERDLSIVINEDVTWSAVENIVFTQKLQHIVGTEFVGTYRGKPIEKGKKSVSLRMLFRHQERTLEHSEIDSEIEKIVQAFSQQLQATLRA